MNDTLLFADEQDDSTNAAGDLSSSTWKVLIVDDQPDVHNVTKLVLEGYTFQGRQVTCLSAYSGAEAKQLILDHPDAAVVLLDVVMETRKAGLEVAEYIRSTIRNQLLRIILRTGQAGEAPERDVVTQLDINDYRQKTELTADRLITAVTTAIRSYRDLKVINDSRRGLYLLAMSIAHQVRNRTIAIAGFANIIRRKELPEGVEEYLQTILEESAKLEGMVSDVTNFASVQMKEVSACNVRELLERAMERVEQGLDASHNIQWKLMTPDQSILVDPELFVEAMGAILDNCVDFSGDDPIIEITVHPERLSCMIEIVDYGTGISPADLPFVYDPFFTRKPDGSGMGLCIVRRVAMEHQWDVAINSVEGKGTIVKVVIPRREMTGVD